MSIIKQKCGFNIFKNNSANGKVKYAATCVNCNKTYNFTTSQRLNKHRYR